MSNVTAVPLQPVKRSYIVWLALAVLLALVAAYALATRAPTRPQTASGLQYRIIKPGAPGGAAPDRHRRRADPLRRQAAQRHDLRQVGAADTDAGVRRRARAFPKRSS